MVLPAGVLLTIIATNPKQSLLPMNQVNILKDKILIKT